MRKWIVVATLIVLLVVGLFSKWWLFGSTHAAASVTIGEGMSARAVGEELQKAGAIRSARGFRWYARLFADAGTLKPGTFAVPADTSLDDLWSILTNQEFTDVVVVIPEGFTLTQVGETVRKALPGITLLEWQAATGVNSPLKKEGIGRFIPEDHDLEGYLFPDTYRFHPTDGAEAAARKMIETLARRLSEADLFLENNGTFSNGKTLHETLTLASIVEREVRGAEDKRKVADLFLRRLDRGMALQADSTVNYATGGNRPAVTGDDLQTDSPYNTYKYPGLPPGPISHPGIESIEAVLHPTPNHALYFLTDAAGHVYYAATYEEHLENKRKFLR
ncbi:endolytic transglycosylase MltG [Candidatus Uhrbacteria bacterium]|nr:endolytic transglycosylase MltG [Candidatus Uhrbacteria bacterium]